MLVIGGVFIILFLAWQFYLERVQERITDAKIRSFWTTPPLMKLSIWSRSKGQMAVMLCIGFLEWSSFLSFAFWVQVRQTFTPNTVLILTLKCLGLPVVLPRVHAPVTNSYYDPLNAHVCHRSHM